MLGYKGHGGVGIRPRPRSRGFPGSKPDFIRDLSDVQARHALNPTSGVKRCLAGRVRNLGRGIPNQGSSSPPSQGLKVKSFIPVIRSVYGIVEHFEFNFTFFFLKDVSAFAYANTEYVFQVVVYIKYS
ncbi:hypothetical protein AVEN_215964-1 [Araneus ventricosus]|uniref:Uncharacterized protein n=1 Tax=Araneus ventricosus TaxID=182803 RepID=A0A4Y2L5B8_ARAVE|nr:hypothetical protein AVEN_215964-1 [Araneus ventricosus]